jgi:hypothetical protein
MRLMILSFLSLFSIGMNIPVHFGPEQSWMFLMYSIGVQLTALNSIIWVQMDILGLFSPISGLSDRFTYWCRVVLCGLFVVTVPIPIIRVMIQVYGFGYSPEIARILILTIAPNILFCVVYELWQESYVLYILRRYLKEEKEISSTRRKHFMRLLLLVALATTHDLVATCVYFTETPALRIFRMAINVHFLFVAWIFHSMLKVTLCERSEAPAIPVAIVEVNQMSNQEGFDVQEILFARPDMTESEIKMATIIHDPSHQEDLSIHFAQIGHRRSRDFVYETPTTSTVKF